MCFVCVFKQSTYISITRRLIIIVVCLLSTSITSVFSLHGDGTADIVSPNDMVCTECPTTHYCPGNGLQPVGCPSNSASSFSSSSKVIHDCVCNAGYLKTCTVQGNAEEGSDCSDVTIFTCEEGQTPNFYQQGIRQSCPANEETTIPIATSDEDCVCIPGFEDLDLSAIEANCQACSSDEYTANYNELGCTACPDYSGHDSTEVSDVDTCDCNMGYYGSIDSAFDPTSATPCTGCPAGTFKGSRGDGSEADLCESCLEDKYSLTAASVCLNCRANSQVASGEGTNAEACKCNAGFDVADGDSNFLNPCVECEIGKFQSIASNDDCQSCDLFTPPATQVTYYFVTSGENCEAVGYTTITDLTECSVANPDDKNEQAYELDTTSCFKRPLGCIQLESNKNAFLHSAGTCSDYELYECGHIVGSATYNCVCKQTTVVTPAEYYYQDSIGSIECNGCSTNAQSKIDYSGCECKMGHFGVHASNVNPTCSACANGEYQEFVGQEECEDCPPAAWHTSSASHARSDCVCNAGYYTGTDILQDATYCQSCLSGTYKDTAANTATCTTCPAHSETDEALLSVFIEGSLNSQSTCVCKAGFYNVNTGSPNNLDCQPCVPGTFKAGQGNEACTACEADHYQNLEGQLACKDCPANSNSATGSSAVTDCQCNAGYSGTIATDVDACEACGPGTYQTSDICDNCGTGKYQPESGKTECLACVSNSDSTEADRSKCLCNRGHTCPMTAAVQPGCKAMQLGRGIDDTMEELTSLNRAQTCGTNFDSPCLVTGTWGDLDYCHHSACALTGICKVVDCSATGHGYPCAWLHQRHTLYDYYEPNHVLYGVIDTGWQCQKNGETARLDRYGTDASDGTDKFLWLRWDLERSIYVSGIGIIVKLDNLVTDGIDVGSFELESETYRNVDDYKYWGFANVRLSNADTATPPEGQDIVHHFDLEDGITQYNFPVKQARFIWFQYDDNGDDTINKVIFNGIHVTTPCAGLECPDGDCVPCLADTYKDTIDYAACTYCQEFAQSPLASTLEDDCKCNRGYAQNGILCEACSPGQYTISYQFDSGTPGDDTDDLDAMSCASCGHYQYTSLHPGTSDTDCEYCTDSEPTTNCEHGNYWESGCLIDMAIGFPTIQNNKEFVCAACTAVLTSTDTASDENDYNRGPEACVCEAGAGFNPDPIGSGNVADLIMSLFDNYLPRSQPYSDWSQTTHNAIFSFSRLGYDFDISTEETSNSDILTSKKFTINNHNSGKGYRWSFDSQNTLGRLWIRVDLQYEYRLKDVLLSLVDAASVTLHTEKFTMLFSKRSQDTFQEAWLDDANLAQTDEVRKMVQSGQDSGTFWAYVQFITDSIENSPNQWGSMEKYRYIWIVEKDCLADASCADNTKTFALRYVQVQSYSKLPAQCELCAIGTFKSELANEPCALCSESNTLTASTGAEAESECVCASGYEYVAEAEACQKCEEGKFKGSTSSVSDCLSCDVDQDANSGSWGPVPTVAGDIQDEVTGLSACTCDAGFEPTAGGCTACPAGKFKAFGGDQPCEDCAAGEYAAAPAVDAAGALACSICHSNARSLKGASICQCIAGYQNSDDGSTYSSSGHQCVSCNHGTDFKDAQSLDQCELCDTVCGQNEYMQTECTTSSNRDCQQCNSDSNTPVDNTALNCFCNKGYEFTSAPDTCTECDPGEFNAYDNDNTKVCISCPDGKFEASSGSAECDDCFTSCTSVTGYEIIYPQYISTECTAIAQIICSPCTDDNSGCTAGKYDESQCGPEKSDASTCVPCLTNSYCTGAYNQPVQCTPAGSVSLAPRESIDDCGCPPGEHSDGSNCVPCTGNVFCSSGIKKNCPLDSTQSGTDFTDIADCTCDSGYYRRSDDDVINEITRVNLVDEIWDGNPHPDDNFVCVECNTQAGVDNSYCTGDNTRSICTDINAETESGSDDISHCKCKAGYYYEASTSQCQVCLNSDNIYCPSNQNEAVLCSNVGENRKTIRDGADNVEDCVCIANFYLVDPDGLNSCQPCLPNNYCPGGDVIDPGIIIPCPGNEGNPDRVESYASSSSISQCVCKAGFGCKAGINCPGDTSDSNLLCPSCIASAPTTRSDGTFKKLRGNAECADCLVCETTQYVNPNNANAHQCSTTSNRVCSPCTTCGPVETKQVGSITIETGGKYQTSTCDADRDRSCSDCTTCENHWVDASFDDVSYENSACNNLFNDRQCLNYNLNVDSAPQCSIGEYRGQHSWNQNSICDNCDLGVDPSYYSNTAVYLHTWTAHGQIYDDKKSCPFDCKTNTVFLNPADPLEGCVSCETGNVLYKDISTKIEGSNKVCDFNCLYGSVKNEAGNDCVPISSIHHTSTFFTVEAHDQKKDNMLQFKLKFDDVSDYVITLQKEKSTCNPRGPKCCFSSSKRIYSQTSYLLLDDCGVSLDDEYETTEELQASGAFKEITFKIDEDRMKSDTTFFDCRTETHSTYCSFTFSFVDVLLRRAQNQHIEMRIWRGSYDINIKENQHYIPLSVLAPQLSYVHLSDSSPQIHTYELKLDIALLSDSITIDMPSGTTYEAEIQSVRDISNQKYLLISNNFDPSGDRVGKCERHSISSSSEWSQTISIDSTTKQWTTLWTTDAPHTKPNFIMFLLKIHSINPNTQHRSLLSYLKILRSTKELKLLCQNVATLITFNVASAYIAVGLDPEFKKLQLSSQYNANNAFNRHGYESRLVSLILTPSNTIPTTISELQVLAVHITSDLKQNAELQAATTMEENKLLFTKEFTSWCYENTCEFEYIRDIQTVDCSATTPTESWLNANIGTNTDLVISNGCSRRSTLGFATPLFTIFKLRRGVFSKTFDENFSDLETWTYIFTAAKFMDT